MPECHGVVMVAVMLRKYSTCKFSTEETLKH